MYNLEERVTAVEHKTSRLEEVLESFIVHTRESLDRLEREMLDFKNEMREFKDEMRDFKDEMRDFKDEMKDFKDEMRQDRKEMNKKWGELSNKLGTIVEDIIFPATRPVIKKYFKCDLEFIGIRIQKKDKKTNQREEFDVVAACDDKVFLIEVKTTLRPQYIEQFKEKMERFRAFFPEYNDKKLIPILASLNIDENFLNMLAKENIYGMAYREWEYMDILNFDKVKQG